MTCDFIYPTFSRIFIPVFNTSSRICQFIRCHASVTYKNNFMVFSKFIKNILCIDSIFISSVIVFPYRLINTVMKIVIFKIFKLRLGCRKELFTNFYKRIHRAANIKEYNKINVVHFFTNILKL